MKEIHDLTLKIEEQYPELYRHLDENPATISRGEHSQIDTKNFSDYLESLKALLAHVANHQREIATE
ncbi:hypothetical protein C900_05281 [Fulvivirga imtechensis AK7]|uniref:Uncharacterized protein n=2 Tax=Fulvivirga TaxID=396811 RepID=L8JK81_9BACT|nr:hypothetical protein C900_05281 [Fulvivirga imtechensis AK7]